MAPAMTNRITTNSFTPDIGDASEPAALDPRAFRGGMAKLAAAVNVITTVHDGEPYGFTASAVCSVTDTPPTLLVCVNRSNRTHPVIAASRILCVNTLSGPHAELSMAFAGGSAPMVERFGHGEWASIVTGAPALVDAAVAFDCRVSAFHEVGTHDVLFCEVVAIRESAQTESLVYFDRRFHRLG
ncbi:flavin reductase [Ancylobacter defluvii]|uniref:FMN reductase (NADH) RutF n=1 Tax=Ancylobacter defluvii TaxID=1282440 RepID=A0A9W6NCS9_9HYPH|nr:flavin reductase [Ancylobacter defluvii]GLK86128.1 FMN reductase (NADH) RutF [Ancylobacter defluvii]